MGALAMKMPSLYRWTQVTENAPFAPRDGAGALVFDRRMWLLGGWNPDDKVHFPLICNNEVWNSTDGKAWALVKPNTFVSSAFDPAADWEGRHTAGYVVFRDRMWIVGGDVNQGHYQNDVWSSSDGQYWERTSGDVPWGPRVLHYTVVFQGRIWVMGGQTLELARATSGTTVPRSEANATRFYTDVWSSDDGVHWDKVTDEPIRDGQRPAWSPRGMIGGSAVFQDRIWILGGGTYSTPDVPQRRFYNDVWSSADGVHWQCHLEHAPWHPRQYHEVAVFDDRLWVLEGWNQSNRNDVWHSIDGIEWQSLPDTPWAPRHAASVFVFQNALWLVGGNNMESDVWRLDSCSGDRQAGA